MSPGFPDLLDLWRCVDIEAEYAGSLPLSRFPRLADHLADTAGEVAASLRFMHDAEGRGVIRGEVKAELRLVCQRCLGGVDHGVDKAFTLALIRSLDEAHRLPDQYEPIVVPDAMVHPAELVEDELLLAMPQIPMHGYGECQPEGGADRKTGAAEKGPERAHPFAALASLKGLSGE